MELLKENFGNTQSFVPRNKAIANGDTISRIKHAMKPLSDVKNILSDKNCFSQPQNKEDVNTYTKSNVQSEDYGDLLFYEELEDDYSDIIPKSLQLNSEDIKNLSSVFDMPYDISKTEVNLGPLTLPDIELFLTDDEDDYDSFKELKARIDSNEDMFDIVLAI